MEVSPGFKQTEVGVIPSDWEISTLDSVVLKFQNGYAFPSDGYVGSGVPIITMAQIGLSGLFQFDEESVNYWPSEKADKLKDFVVSFGDIIIAMTDVTPQKNLIGRMTCVNKHGPFLLNQRVGLLKLDKQKIDAQFIRALSNSSFWRSYSRGVATLGVQANIGTKELKSGKIPLPPIVEQRIIATALSDVDALLDSLDRLIAKKRDLKKAAMQQLLTGKTRLQGFSGKWEVRCLGEMVSPNVRWAFTGGPFGSNLKSSDYTDDGVRIIQLQNIGDGVFLDEYKIFTSVKKADELLSCNIYPGEIILSKMGDPVARACIIPTKHSRYLMCSDGIRLALDQSRFCTYFIFSVINASVFREKASNAGTGSTRKRIGLTELRSLDIECPPIAEQTAIAAVLSEIDAEITALEVRRKKTAALKQGMMQELLTGRTRLV